MGSGMAKLQEHQQQHHVYEKQYHAFQHEFVRASQLLESAEREIGHLEKQMQDGESLSRVGASPESSPEASPLSTFQSLASSSSEDTHFSIMPW